MLYGVKAPCHIFRLVITSPEESDCPPTRTTLVPLAAATHISATRSKPVDVSGCLLQVRPSDEYQTAPEESDLMAETSMPLRRSRGILSRAG